VRQRRPAHPQQVLPVAQSGRALANLSSNTRRQAAWPLATGLLLLLDLGAAWMLHTRNLRIEK